MKRFSAAWLVLGLLAHAYVATPALAEGEAVNAYVAASTVTGSANAASTTQGFVEHDVSKYAAAVVQFTSIGSGNTVTFEGSSDNVTWFTLPGYTLSGAAHTGAVSPSTSVANVVPLNTRYFRVRLSTYSSGTVAATVTFKASGFDPAQVGAPTVAGGAVADDAVASGNPVPVGGRHSTTTPTFSDGDRVEARFTNRGEQIVALSLGGSQVGVSSAPGDALTNTQNTLITVGKGYVFNGTDWDRARGNSTGGAFVQGAIASGSADSGNPVKVGCKYNFTPANVADGQRVDCQASIKGFVRQSLWDDSTNTAAAVTSSWADAQAVGNGLQVRAYPYLYAGSSTNADREFTCPSSAVINVSAAATTQLVALQSSQIIRVCSFVISGDTAATTATFVYGTGANCGTGTTSITGAMRMVDEGNISATGMNGSLFRTIASNALCLTAATGAVTGFVTYAQY